LAQYFFYRGRKLEGRYSITIAISLVLGTSMHRIYTSGVSFSGHETPQTQFWREKAETRRISAFWTVLALNSFWTAIDGHVTGLPYWTARMRVDTPWP
ncbi:hypothetical protein K435DRAFT_563982, partial [Dendrothele bispora CBS 962.96]